MRRIQLLTGVFLAVGFSCLPQIAQAHPGVRWSIGLNFGVPGYYRPYGYGYGYGWGPYSPYYAVPAPLIYEPAPVFVRPAPVVVQSVPLSAPLPPAQLPPPVSAAPSSSVVPVRNDVVPSLPTDGRFPQLRDANETVRRDAVMDLGRRKAQNAIEPLTYLLAKDPSPLVRDAAARALGLIGSARSLNTLIYAAQADNDRDVRHSAQFAVEVIRTNLKGN